MIQLLPANSLSRVLLLMVLPMLAAATTPLHAQSDWESKKNKDGIQVWVREIADLPLKESKATVIFVGNVDKVMATIFDYTSYGDWAPRFIEAREVSRPTENVIISYSLNDSPWPVTDRDMVMRNTIERRENGSVYIGMEAVKGEVPLHKTAVRMEMYKGYYLLEPKPGNQVAVTYQAVMDPAGSIPAWMANMAVVDTPYDLLYNLRRQVAGQ